MVEKGGYLVDADGVIEFPHRVARRGNFIMEWYSGGRLRVRTIEPPANENAQLRALVRRTEAADLGTGF